MKEIWFFLDTYPLISVLALYGAVDLISFCFREVCLETGVRFDKQTKRVNEALELLEEHHDITERGGPNLAMQVTEILRGRP